MEKDIYSMELHETMSTGAPAYRYIVIRVPGGWIYDNEDVAVFVPFNNEFQNTQKDKE